MLDLGKSGVLTAVSLTVIALVSTLSFRGSDTSDESSLSVSSLNPIVQWTKLNRVIGSEYEYRANGASVPSYSKTGIIGYLESTSKTGTVELKVFASSSNPNVQKYSTGESDPNYSRSLGVAGYCYTKRVLGSEPLYQRSKLNPLLKRKEYVYAAGAAKSASLSAAGWMKPLLLCYVHKSRTIPKPTPKPTPAPTPKPTPKPASTPAPKQAPGSVSTTTRSINELMRSGSSFGVEFEYRVMFSSVPGFKSRGSIGKVWTGYSSGLRALKVYSLGSQTKYRRFVTYGPRDRGYTKYVKLAGYCSRTNTGGLLRLTERMRYNRELRRWDFAYCTNSEKCNSLTKAGFGSGSHLCWVKPPNHDRAAPNTVVVPSVSSNYREVFRFEKKLSDGKVLYEYRNTQSSRPSGYLYKGLAGWRLFRSRSKPNLVLMSLNYNFGNRDSQLTVGPERSPGYNRRIATMGYCSRTSGSGMSPLFEMIRYSGRTVIDHAYALPHERTTFLRRGFRSEGTLCYVPRA